MVDHTVEINWYRYDGRCSIPDVANGIYSLCWNFELPIDVIGKIKSVRLSINGALFFGYNIVDPGQMFNFRNTIGCFVKIPAIYGQTFLDFEYKEGISFARRYRDFLRFKQSWIPYGDYRGQDIGIDQPILVSCNEQHRDDDYFIDGHYRRRLRGFELVEEPKIIG